LMVKVRGAANRRVIAASLTICVWFLLNKLVL